MNETSDVHSKAKKGAYFLIISVTKPSVVNVGQLGELQLLPGMYLYVGSALGMGSTSLQHRLARHQLKTKCMKKHWHIDFITTLPHAKVHYIVVVETSRRLECLLSKHIAQLDGVGCPLKGFGSSDCSQCETHFYSYAKNIEQAVKACNNIVQKLGIRPKIISAEAHSGK